MMDDWLGIRPHHKFVPQYTQATKKPKEMGATGSFNLSCTGLLAPASPQLSARPHPICSGFPPFGCTGPPEAELHRGPLSLMCAFSTWAKAVSPGRDYLLPSVFWLQLMRAVSLPFRRQHLPLSLAPDPTIYRHSCQNRVSVPRF